MVTQLKSSSSDINDFIVNLQIGISDIIKDDLIGIYIHGSLAMGGFNPNSSDIDVLVVTNKLMTVQTKRELAKLLLMHSNSPFPVEISFLNKEQLKVWQHPCPYDFHYSEFWRERYANDLSNGTIEFLNCDVNVDADLAAHITITNNRGVCIYGRSIEKVFPLIPSSDYLSSILNDFEDCLENIEEDLIYCTLNLIRVYWYLTEGVISSKQEAGNWGLTALPKEIKNTVEKVVKCYSCDKNTYDFERNELVLLKNYISNNVQELLK
ncbi:aminoglycoside adenylyltransferase domain-containing protein [Jeotgalibacillus aurantiacus]|uniref:aminoglycoside adenylyltransferase domain-containing protein n=1 Tax=Jeotgalibacillus aurantiacus TaxID=2763266 RepID=UPI001D0A57D3|nr:aminoglycoside adenylyltransferase domain-containing protein [Jeotgalibacillus aurantiacus]